MFWALIGLIVFGIVAIFVQIPNIPLIYAILGLVIFAGLTASDFQRLRRNQDIPTADPEGPGSISGAPNLPAAARHR